MAVICLASGETRLQEASKEGHSLSVRLLDRITFRCLSRVALALTYALGVSTPASLSMLRWPLCWPVVRLARGGSE